MNSKKILKYFIFLLPWFLSGLIFKTDINYYNQLTKPIFTPPSAVFPIVWAILYLSISYSIYNIWFHSNSNYRIYLFINYFANQLYPFCFFQVKNNFLAFTNTIIIFISSLYLFQETKIINQKYSKYLIPYICWNLYALILSFAILIFN